jgi:hypothetical protein
LACQAGGLLTLVEHLTSCCICCSSCKGCSGSTTGTSGGGPKSCSGCNGSNSGNGRSRIVCSSSGVTAGAGIETAARGRADRSFVGVTVGVCPVCLACLK